MRGRNPGGGGPGKCRWEINERWERLGVGKGGDEKERQSRSGEEEGELREGMVKGCRATKGKERE